MYLRFSSSFSCSARSRPKAADGGSGVAPLESGTWSLDLLAANFSEEPGGRTRGEFAILMTG